MKAILCIIFILFACSVFAVSEYSLIFLAIDPSSINRAIGGDAVGVINVWHNSPATANFNPALAALHKGISYSYTKDNWFEGAGLGNDMYFHSALVNIGFSGIGITLPAPNADGQWGTEIDYGLQKITDEYGNNIGSFNSYETAAIAGIAVNLTELYRNFNTVPAFWKSIDVAFGINNKFITSHLGPGTIETGEELNDKGVKVNSTDLGAVAIYTHNFKDYASVQGAVGYTAFNVMDTKISYIDDEQSDPVYAHLSWGYALSGNILADKLLADYVRPEYIFCRNLFSFRYLNGSVDNKYDSTITGIGTELGFFDTFFLRNGRYDDPDGSIVGKTHGWGLNLHYKDVISYNYNYAVFAGGELMPEQDSYDHNVSLNLLLLSRLISGK